MKRTNSMLLGVCLALAASVAIAETKSVVVEMKGAVLVNQGEQFIAVPNGTSLTMGNQVMAMDGASAIIRYEDGCDLEVKPGTVVTLSDRSPCAGWIPVVETISPGSAALGNVGVVATTSDSGLPVFLTIVGVIGGTLLIDEFNRDDVASP